MRALVFLPLLTLAGCKHEPEKKDEPVATKREEPLLRAGELIVGTTDAVSVDALLELAATEGYRVEYVAAASETTHLLKVLHADGTDLSVDDTKALAAQLTTGGKFKFVELNAVQQRR